jgi:prepilin-type N-terminal cleavage/methylation domain-containing protein
MRKAKGFSLVELLIVVAIILIIAAIAIPNLVKSKMAANEAAAVGSVRTVVTSELTYASIFPSTGFTSLANLYSAGLIDSVLGGGSKSGYSFVTVAGSATPASTFTANANPITVGTTGTNYYRSDQTGVIQRNSTSFGTSTNPGTGGTPLGQ